MAEEQSDGSPILEWYEKLPSRSVDLVGDYAGNEVFLIEGDSLLLNCFSDSRVDFEDGFQLLHAVYAIEKFLAGLLQRKCNFHIAFFAKHEQLCLPPTVSSENHAKYLLAREVIVRHLQKHLPAVHPSVKVSVFDNLRSQDFREYLQSSSIYFVMLHDGAQTGSPQRQLVTQREGLSSSKVDFRSMISFFMHLGYNVALINGLKWMDTKVLTLVLERSRERKSTVEPEPTSSHTLNGSGVTANDSKDGIKLDQLVSALKASELPLSPRICLVLLATGIMLSRKISGQSLVVRFLMHTALLWHIPLYCRSFPELPATEHSEKFLQDFAKVAYEVMHSSQWPQLDGFSLTSCDLADLVDGRLFRAVNTRFHEVFDTIGSKSNAVNTFRKLANVLTSTYNVHLNLSSLKQEQVEQDKVNGEGARPIEHQPPQIRARQVRVLPFSNAVFDTHLSSISIDIDDSDSARTSLLSDRVFKEVSHWHNVNSLSTRQRARKLGFFALRREQYFMAEMRNYAASLTNAVGKVLEPETIVTNGLTNTKPRKTQIPTQDGYPQPREFSQSKKSGQAKLSKKDAFIAANVAQKSQTEETKLYRAWDHKRQQLDSESALESRFSSTMAYLHSLHEKGDGILQAEVQCYALSILVELWIRTCRDGRKEDAIGLAPLLWELLVKLNATANLTKTLVRRIQLTSDALGIRLISTKQPITDRALSYGFPLPVPKMEALAIGMPLMDFQLVHCGPFFDRNYDSSADARVPFKPDAWQKKVLDEIDANRSLFVVAPTSAGKTFISFYAMQKILQAGDEDVLVYVAPSQSNRSGDSSTILEELQTRGQIGCQILVTVPHILQIMLLAPTNARGWSTRVKRIILDEIHCIGQADDGLIWEQLLLLAHCPIIALSATVGNPAEFKDWLASTQAANNIQLTPVVHAHRYSDLRKYIYNPPESFTFTGLNEKRSFSALGLDNNNDFAFVHPVASLINRSRGMPDDLALEARDCFSLWQSMTRHATEEFPVTASLSPSKSLPQVIRKIDIIRWEEKLKDLLRVWMAESTAPFDSVLEDLSQPIRKVAQVDNKTPKRHEGSLSLGLQTLLTTTLPLLSRLHEMDALPAILFNYDRTGCESIAKSILDQLVSSEDAWKASSTKWKRKVERWQEWKELEAKKVKRLGDPKAKKSKAGKKKNSDDEYEVEDDGDGIASKDRTGGETSMFAMFDPEAPIEAFNFADQKKLPRSELETYFRRLRARGVSEWLMAALQRGIGVHHAGMERRYRQTVEILFRKGFLRVVIATGTLALGINMPCKTVVFSGDSVFLTALNYRQAAGRAGRRGFDLLGNVVFQDIATDKVCRLLSSRLPDLNGHFPITTTLVLRLFTLLHDSSQSQYAKKAIDSLLSQPRLYLGAPIFKDQVLHHLRFSIEYLRRQYLLSSTGAPLNFAGCVSHLYFTENSSFAFHALLKEGFFHELCFGLDRNEGQTLHDLMLVMAHLFGRRNCRQADKEFIDKIVKKSPSVVFLPPLPKHAVAILRQHNQETLDVFYTYVKTFVEQRVTDEDCILPLTKLRMGGTSQPDEAKCFDPLPRTTVRSAFVALSGHGDEFESISDLCSTSRDGVFLEESVIPHVDIYPEETSDPLNAYLLDFFKHGDVSALEKANGIRRGDVWFLLNDFSLVLATIVTSLKNFMKPGSDDDVDMIDLMGSGDAHETAEDDRIAAAEAANVVQAGNAESHEAAPRVNAKKKDTAKVADEWDADFTKEVDGDFDQERENGQKGKLKKGAAKGWEGSEDSGAESEEPSLPAWEDGGRGGLGDVLKAFEKLKEEFDTKFKAMWA